MQDAINHYREQLERPVPPELGRPVPRPEPAAPNDPHPSGLNRAARRRRERVR